jgi:multicomponent Na+:H+ antiporter subunit B
MRSLILQTIARLVMYLLLVLSIYLLLRGHNAPGGGFIAGLLAASSFTLMLVAFDLDTVERMVPISFPTLTAIGLVIAGLTGVAPMLLGLPFLTGGFDYFTFPIVGEVELASALVFDIGVYLTVQGSVLTVLTLVVQRDAVDVDDDNVQAAVEEDSELWRS